MSKHTPTDILDGWCNFHQTTHHEDKGRNASPSRHDHLAPEPHPYQWFIDTPDAWVVLTTEGAK